MRKNYYSYIYMLPILIIYTLLFTVPVLYGFGASLTNWTAVTEGNVKFVGLYHYINYFKAVLSNGSNGAEGAAIFNTFLYSFLVMIIQNVLALALALILNMKLKTSGFIRSAFFMPCVIGSLVIAYTFNAVLYPGGPFDTLLTSFGMEDLIHSWLTEKYVTVIVIAIINIWMFLGFSATIYLAGLKSVPSELMEAADTDGASKWLKFKHITFPLIAPSLTINMLLSLIGSLKEFSLAYLLTGNTFTHNFFINTYVYSNLSTRNYAYGSSISVMLFIITILIALPLLKTLRKREVEM